MSYEQEAIRMYRTVTRAAARACRRTERKGTNLCLSPLSAVLDEELLSYTIDLGVREIPVNQIVGVASAGEKANEYIADFLPLSSDSSKFSRQWCQMYADISGNVGMVSPIRCYEYLGKFYVQDGLKRVSVLKCLGIETVSSQVIRYMPKHTTDPVVQNYYEFLIYYRQTKLYQLVFTQPKDFYILQHSLGYASGHVWSEQERYEFMTFWSKFAVACRLTFEYQSRYTAADYLVALLEDYTFTRAQAMTVEELSSAIQQTQSYIDAGGHICKTEPAQRNVSPVVPESWFKQFCTCINALGLFKDISKKAII